MFHHLSIEIKKIIIVEIIKRIQNYTNDNFENNFNRIVLNNTQ